MVNQWLTSALKLEFQIVVMTMVIKNPVFCALYKWDVADLFLSNIAVLSNDMPTFDRNVHLTPCSAVIRGLRGLNFVDKTDGMKEKTEEREEVRIEGFTDRLYMAAPDEVTLGGLEGGRCLKLTKVRTRPTCHSG